MTKKQTQAVHQRSDTLYHQSLEINSYHGPPTVVYDLAHSSKGTRTVKQRPAHMSLKRSQPMSTDTARSEGGGETSVG